MLCTAVPPPRRRTGLSGKGFDAGAGQSQLLQSPLVKSAGIKSQLCSLQSPKVRVLRQRGPPDSRWPRFGWCWRIGSLGSP